MVSYGDARRWKAEPLHDSVGRLNTLCTTLVGSSDEMLKLSDRHLLVLDTTGACAKAAIAVGDVDTADHVAVFTPGMNSTVNDRMEGYDRDVAELRDNAKAELEQHGPGRRIGGHRDLVEP